MTGYGQKIVYAYVVADILHSGHIIHLKRAKRYGYLIVGVLTNKAAMEKKPKPIISFEERKYVVENIKCVDEVVPQYTYSPLENVMKLKPDILIESDDHKEQPANEYVKSYGGKVIIDQRSDYSDFPLAIIRDKQYEKQSSTRIKQNVHRQSICNKGK